jgi:hypothetical protein
MAENAGPVSLVVTVGDGTANDDEIDRVTRRLRQQLSELDVEGVKLGPGGRVPAGAKALDPVAAGTLVVTLLPAVVPKVVDFLRAWMLRDAGRTVKIRAASGDRSFDIEYAPGVTSEDDVRRLLETFSDALARTPGRP